MFQMPKSILVYFKSENDAEAARSGLQRLRVTDLYVDHLPEGDNKQSYVPITDLDETNTAKRKGIFKNIFQKEDPMTHLVQAKVQEADYNEAMGILTEVNAYIEQ
jgi:hypothetical protein